MNDEMSILQWAGIHVAEAGFFTVVAITLAPLAIWYLWKWKGVVFAYVDELDDLANALRDRDPNGNPLPRKLSIADKYHLGMAHLPLGLFSGCKLLAIALIVIGIGMVIG